MTPLTVPKTSRPEGRTHTLAVEKQVMPVGSACCQPASHRFRTPGTADPYPNRYGAPNASWSDRALSLTRKVQGV
ncbi:unnamed protein product [Lota lota]